jgi:dienelactone hydrolase
MAYSDDKQQYKVVMPDWFEGKPCPLEWYPPDTEQKQAGLGAFFSTWPPTRIVKSLPGFMEKVNEQFPDTEWAIVGYCWGGKVVSLMAADDSLFKVGASCHPAMINHKDASAIKIPFIMLPSQDEDADAVAKFEAALTVPHHVETFADQIHGWMAARGNLEDERVRAEYVRGYKLIVKFFGENF